MEVHMPEMSRRGFLLTASAAGAVRTLPQVAARIPQKRILSLVYDKSLGMMRAIDRVVP